MVSGDQIYMVAADGTGCKAIKLTAPDVAEVVYANKVMKNLPGVVLFDGHIYGYSDSIGWICQNWEAGEEVWVLEGTGQRHRHHRRRPDVLPHRRQGSRGAG